MYIVDIAVPRDVEAAAGDLDDVYLYTVDDLHGVIEENLKTVRRLHTRPKKSLTHTSFILWTGCTL